MIKIRVYRRRPTKKVLRNINIAPTTIMTMPCSAIAILTAVNRPSGINAVSSDEFGNCGQHAEMSDFQS